VWLQVYIIIVSWYSVFEDKLFENSENKIKDEYMKKGKIRIARKLKKGTYTLKINVKADGNSNFKAKKKPVYVKVIVK